jgi:DNA uptake protein ComE-like DNA-binding protein
MRQNDVASLAPARDHGACPVIRLRCLRDCRLSVATANERKALWFLALVALSGSSVRLWRANAPDAGVVESAALERQIGRVDSVRALRHTSKDARRSTASADSETPRVPPGPVDLDRASADEIEALPGIGPALAKRIAAAGDSVGGFGRIEALCDVSGIGPALVERLRPLVTFTGARRPLSDTCGEASKRPRKTRVARTRKTR